MKTVIYARVSTTTNQSVEMQLRYLRELADRRGFEIVGEYCDEGVGGAKNSRPWLDRLLADAEGVAGSQPLAANFPSSRSALPPSLVSPHLAHLWCV